MRKIILSSRRALLMGALAAAIVVVFFVLPVRCEPIALLDEAQLADRDATTFPQAKDDYRAIACSVVMPGKYFTAPGFVAAPTTWTGSRSVSTMLTFAVWCVAILKAVASVS